MKVFLIFLTTILYFFVAAGTVFATDVKSLREKVKNHPATEFIQSASRGPIWKLQIKENISDTAYDWRYNLRTIVVYAAHIKITNRQCQNSGNSPSSDWCIITSFTDEFTDGTLDEFYKQRFLSVDCSNGSGMRCILIPCWPDNFNYPADFNIDEDIQRKLYEDELTFWKNILQ